MSRPQYTCVLYIADDRIRTVTPSEGIAAYYLTGGTTYNVEPQDTQEMAIHLAKQSAEKFRQSGYVYERCWQRNLRRKAAT